MANSNLQMGMDQNPERTCGSISNMGPPQTMDSTEHNISIKT